MNEARVLADKTNCMIIDSVENSQRWVCIDETNKLLYDLAACNHLLRIEIVKGTNKPM